MWFLVFMSIPKTHLPNILKLRSYIFDSGPMTLALDYCDCYEPLQSKCCHFFYQQCHPGLMKGGGNQTHTTLTNCAIWGFGGRKESNLSVLLPLMLYSFCQTLHPRKMEEGKSVNLDCYHQWSYLGQWRKSGRRTLYIH